MIGHDEVVRQLERELPPVVLLRGPASVGKRTLAEHAVAVHGVLKVDQMHVKQLTADAARAVKRFVTMAPMGPRRVVTIRLDGASEPALNALLKVLEETPESVSFVLLSVDRPLDTIASRAMTYRLGLLTPEQLATVLEAEGLSPEQAASAARVGQGQVKKALARAKPNEGAKARVLAALRAVAGQEPDLLAQALKEWGEAEHGLLQQWLQERLTGRWSQFDGTEVEMSSTMAKQVLAGLRIAARPRLAARVVLEPLVGSRP